MEGPLGRMGFVVSRGCPSDRRLQRGRSAVGPLHPRPVGIVPGGERRQRRCGLQTRVGGRWHTDRRMGGLAPGRRLQGGCAVCPLVGQWAGRLPRWRGLHPAHGGGGSGRVSFRSEGVRIRLFGRKVAASFLWVGGWSRASFKWKAGRRVLRVGGRGRVSFGSEAGSVADSWRLRLVGCAGTAGVRWELEIGRQERRTAWPEAPTGVARAAASPGGTLGRPGHVARRPCSPLGWTRIGWLHRSDASAGGPARGNGRLRITAACPAAGQRSSFPCPDGWRLPPQAAGASSGPMFDRFKGQHPDSSGRLSGGVQRHPAARWISRGRPSVRGWPLAAGGAIHVARPGSFVLWVGGRTASSFGMEVGRGGLFGKEAGAPVESMWSAGARGAGFPWDGGA